MINILYFIFKDKIANAGSIQKKYVLGILLNKKYQTIFYYIELK